MNTQSQRWPPLELLPAGTELGRHRIVGKLAEGAHAILYMGEHVDTGAEVAIKVQRASLVGNQEMLARFARESVVMGRLAGCRSVVQVHDTGALPDGRRYLVMELVRGRELANLVSLAGKRGVPLELERVIAIGRDLAAALRDAHGRNVIHRDLKPSNVMLVRDPDGRETAKLVDFGVSADRDQPAGTGDLTMTGAVIGTPEYMGPEQAVGLPASTTMDIFAFGVVLFELTTGTRPPRGALRGGSVPRASSLRATVPAALDQLIRDCLAVDPQRRPADPIAIMIRLSIAHEQLGMQPEPHAWAESRPLRAAGAIEIDADGAVVQLHGRREAIAAEPPLGAPTVASIVVRIAIAAAIVTAIALAIAGCGRCAVAHSASGPRPSATPPRFLAHHPFLT